MPVKLGKLVLNFEQPAPPPPPVPPRPSPRRPAPRTRGSQARDPERFLSLQQSLQRKLERRSVVPGELKGVQQLRQNGQEQPFPSPILAKLEGFLKRRLPAATLVRGPAVDKAALAIGARAFAADGSVFWSRNAPSLNSQAGQALAAHELDHLDEQRRGQRRPNGEAQARAVEQRFMQQPNQPEAVVRLGAVELQGQARQQGAQVLKRALQMLEEQAPQLSAHFDRLQLSVRIGSGPEAFEKAARQVVAQLVGAARRQARLPGRPSRLGGTRVQMSPDGDAAAKWMLKVETEIDGEILNYNFHDRYPSRPIPISREEMTERGYLPVKYWKWMNKPYVFQVKKGVKPSVALKAIFDEGPSRLECASTAVCVLYRALLEMLGDKEFDKMFPKLMISQDAGENINEGIRRHTRGLKIKKRDELEVGDWVYFSNTRDFLNKHPDSPWQGENAFYVYSKGTKRYYAGFGVPPKLEKDMNMALMSEFNEPAEAETRKEAKKKLMDAWERALEENDGDMDYAMQDEDYLDAVDYYQYWGLNVQRGADKNNMTMTDFKKQGGGLRLDSIRRLSAKPI